MHKETVTYDGNDYEVIVSGHWVCRSVAVRIPGKRQPIAVKLSFPPKMSEREQIDMTVKEAARRNS